MLKSKFAIMFLKCLLYVRNPFKKAKPATKQTVSSALVSGRFVPWSFRYMYKKLFRSVPEICFVDSFFYSTKEQNNSLFLERNDRKPQHLFPCLWVLCMNPHNDYHELN